MDIVDWTTALVDWTVVYIYTYKSVTTHINPYFIHQLLYLEHPRGQTIFKRANHFQEGSNPHLPNINPDINSVYNRNGYRLYTV